MPLQRNGLMHGMLNTDAFVAFFLRGFACVMQDPGRSRRQTTEEPKPEPRPRPAATRWIGEPALVGMNDGRRAILFFAWWSRIPSFFSYDRLFLRWAAVENSGCRMKEPKLLIMQILQVQSFFGLGVMTGVSAARVGLALLSTHDEPFPLVDHPKMALNNRRNQSNSSALIGGFCSRQSSCGAVDRRSSILDRVICQCKRVNTWTLLGLTTKNGGRPAQQRFMWDQKIPFSDQDQRGVFDSVTRRGNLFQGT